METVETLLRDITKPTEPRPAQGEKPETPPPPPPPAKDPEPPPQEKQPEEKQPEKPEEKIIDPAVIESSAELVVGMFDFTQANIFRGLANRKKKKKLTRLYGEGALDRLEILLNEIDAQNSAANLNSPVTMIRTMSAEDIGMLRIEKAAQELIESLPFSDEEKEQLQKPLAAIMKKRGGEIPPEILLLLASVQIFGARTADLIIL